MTTVNAIYFQGWLPVRGAYDGLPSFSSVLFPRVQRTRVYGTVWQDEKGVAIEFHRNRIVRQLYDRPPGSVLQRHVKACFRKRLGANVLGLGINTGAQLSWAARMGTNMLTIS